MLISELMRKRATLVTAMRTLDGDDFKSKAAELGELEDAISNGQIEVQRASEATHVKETKDVELQKVFGKMIRGEEVSGNEREALAISDASIRDAAGKGAFRCPGSGIQILRAVTSSMSAGPANLIPGESTSGLVQLNFPPTPLFDRATLLPAINGTAIPFLAQTADDPFAGVSITSPGTEGDDKVDAGVPAIDSQSISTHELNGFTIVTDLALQRAPDYENLIQKVFRAAIATEINEEIMIKLQAASLTEVARAEALKISLADMINLEEAIRWYWAINGSYGMSQTARGYIRKTTAAGPPYNQAAQLTPEIRPLFLDDFKTLGTAGDLIFGDYKNIKVGVAQEIAFRRTDQGAALVKANSTMFAVFANVGSEVLLPATFAKLVDAAG